MEHCFERLSICQELTVQKKNHTKNPKSILNGEQNFNAMKIGRPTEEGTIKLNMCGIANFYPL